MGEVRKYIEYKYGLKQRTENDIDDWHTAFTIWNYEVNNKGKKWYDESIKKVKKKKEHIYLIREKKILI